MAVETQSVDHDRLMALMGHVIGELGAAVNAGRGRPGIDMRDPHAVVQLGVIGEVRLMLLGEYGHLVTMGGELTG